MSFKCKIGLHSWDGIKCKVCGKARDEEHVLSINMQEYSIPEWNMEFLIPDDWEIQFENQWEQSSFVVFGAGGPKSLSPRPSLILFTEIVKYDGTGLDAYMDNAIIQLKNNFNNFKLIRKSKGIYKGVPSAELEYAYQTDNGIIRELNINNYFGDKERLSFQFICEASDKTVKKDQKLQRKIIDSLKIGANGIRVPYLLPYNFSPNCEICGCALTKPNLDKPEPNRH